MLPLEIEPGAYEDAERIADEIAARDVNRALVFEDELDKTYERIERNPELYAPYGPDTRRCRLRRRLKYMVIYRALPEATRVYMVVHTKRNPKGIRRGLRQRRNEEKRRQLDQEPEGPALEDGLYSTGLYSVLQSVE